ncbi:MAG: exodeoxyribonuclease VII small subunit [Lewinella sp.]|jgi:exodeoxyribonuclease VII small subunit|uniref:exodeoxyribonuclease VII small subunit n=1 Tax=Lewinella sp. TaxID=2004506 RepID=UPI003D6AA15E
MNELSYEEALTELQTILQELQNEQVSIDALSAKSERAEVLLTYCQKKLRDLNAKLAPKEDTPTP